MITGSSSLGELMQKMHRVLQTVEAGVSNETQPYFVLLKNPLHTRFSRVLYFHFYFKGPVSLLE